MRPLCPKSQGKNLFCSRIDNDAQLQRNFDWIGLVDSPVIVRAWKASAHARSIPRRNMRQGNRCSKYPLPDAQWDAFSTIANGGRAGSVEAKASQQPCYPTI